MFKPVRAHVLTQNLLAKLNNKFSSFYAPKIQLSWARSTLGANKESHCCLNGLLDPIRAPTKIPKPSITTTKTVYRCVMFFCHM